MQASDERMDRAGTLFEDMRAIMTSMNKKPGDIDDRLRRWDMARESVAELLPRLAREYDALRLKAVSAGYSHMFAVRVNVVWKTRFEEAVDAAFDTGRITEEEEGALSRTDIVAWGRRRRVERTRLWFAVQMSATIGNDDIECAAVGAGALRKVSGDDAAGVVYGRRIAA